MKIYKFKDRVLYFLKLSSTIKSVPQKCEKIFKLFKVKIKSFVTDSIHAGRFNLEEKISDVGEANFVGMVQYGVDGGRHVRGIIPSGLNEIDV